MTRDQALTQIKTTLEEIAAASVADLFLSPFVSGELLNQATAEPGPSMWIVNRSDVYDSTLEALTRHPIEDIAARALTKLRLRRSPLQTVTPPEANDPLDHIADHSVEDVLGHPLAPFESMIFFARALNEDHRASAALSLTRRYLEHPPHWLPGDPTRESLERTFGDLLLTDPSPYVRAYAARVPFLTGTRLIEALKKETNAFVFGRLLQNPALTREALEESIPRLLHDARLQSAFALQVLALDERLGGTARGRLVQLSPNDALSAFIHEWYLNVA